MKILLLKGKIQKKIKRLQPVPGTIRISLKRYGHCVGRHLRATALVTGWLNPVASHEGRCEHITGFIDKHGWATKRVKRFPVQDDIPQLWIAIKCFKEKKRYAATGDNFVDRASGPAASHGHNHHRNCN